jgi:hypothetical protein
VWRRGRGEAIQRDRAHPVHDSGFHVYSMDALHRGMLFALPSYIRHAHAQPRMHARSWMGESIALRMDSSDVVTGDRRSRFPYCLVWCIRGMRLIGWGASWVAGTEVMHTDSRALTCCRDTHSCCLETGLTY